MARRSARIAHGAAVAGAVVAAVVILLAGLGRRFLVGWAVLVAATYFILYKLVRRVAFEVMRKKSEAGAAETH